MKFIKMHGLGNDFIFIEPHQYPDIDVFQLARQMCNRHIGIGGDGLVCVLPSEQADIRMQIINADGSEPEQCGNAIRCLAKYVYEQGIVQKQEITVETKAGDQKVWLEVTNGVVEMIQVDMGKPILEAAQIPVKGTGIKIAEPIEVDDQQFHFTAVSMGNPHMVIEVDDAETFPVQAWGSMLEQHLLYPQKTNVEFITIQSPDEITMRVWERGVGITQACGTGACATAVASVLLEKTKRQVVVHLQGGDLSIDWSEDDDHVYMTGSATTVFVGEFYI